MGKVYSMTIKYSDSKRIVATSADVEISGTVTTSGSDTIITFTGDGTFTPTSAFNVEYLVVAGGGGGGGGFQSPGGAGGGGGGYKTNVGGTALGVTAQSYSINVGDGGIAGVGDNVYASYIQAGNGGDSSIVPTSGTSIISTGGGSGGVYNAVAGGNGGSGGGGSYGSTVGTGIGGQGYAGGVGVTSASQNSGGGGGAGGTGGTGGSTADSISGVGGIGISSTIFDGTTDWYSGGGGAGQGYDGNTANTAIRAVGGSGVGGSGGKNRTPSSDYYGLNGTANTGGGGGGGGAGGNGSFPHSLGGSGGSGVVIIKFATSGNTYDVDIGGKPTNVQDNSILVEKDTGMRYWFDDAFNKTGLKAYYKFDETSGNLINQSTSADSLGTNADGTAGGNPTYSETGVIDSAINFDGVGDYFELGSSNSQWNFLHNDSAHWTLSFWMKLNSIEPSSTVGIMGTHAYTASSNVGMGLFLRDDSAKDHMLEVQIGNLNGNPTAFTSSASYIPKNTTTWYHYIITNDYDGTNNINIYRDNANNESGTIAGTNTNGNSDHSMLLALDAVAQGRFSDCLFDEFSMWDRVITADERASLYNSGTGNTVDTAKGATWTSDYSATRGVAMGGGQNSWSVLMEYITIATLGNATNFGNLTVTRARGCGVSSTTRGVAICGSDAAGEIVSMDYITIATAGNATDFGDSTQARTGVAGVSNLTRGVAFCGWAVTGNSNVIDYITIATTGNALDFGDATVVQRYNSGTGNLTRGLFGGAYKSNATADIEYITIGTLGNGTTFGDLTVIRNQGTALGSFTRAVFCGGSTNTLDYVTIATLGNATDFGDTLSSPTTALGTVTSNIRGCMLGGHSLSNVIQYITIATPSNALDFGDLVAGNHEMMGVEA